jgi:hypothetical protein
VITIIVIIILAAAVILTLTNNNPITNAKQASFVNDLDSFKSELDMYKASEYAKRIGDFEQTSLQGTEASLTFEGQTPEEAPSQTMYTAIPSLKGISKYQGQFAIKDGQLVYMGTDTQRRTWAEGVGVKYEIPGEPEIVSIPPAQTVVEPATDVVYTIRITSTATLTMISDLSSKIKVTDTAGVALATQPEIVLGAVTGSNTLKEFTVTVKTTSLPYGSYKIKVESGIATNAENVPNQEYITVNAFEIADNIPPAIPEITANPTEYTSGNVSVTIDYKDADVKLYSFTGNVGDWQIYTTSLTITTNNTTVYAMGKDNAGNETGLVTKTIANIDKVAPQDAVSNLTVTDDTISGTITMIDNESGIDLANSKYLVTTSSTALATNATEWNTATVLTTNPQSISVTKDNGDYYVQTLSIDAVGNKRVSVSGVITVAASDIIDPGYVASKGVNGPVLRKGMIPIKWSGTTMVDTTTSDTTWYDYTVKQWANARTADGSMWIWIPRYEYKIPTPHSNTAQTIAVNFVNGTSTTATSGYIIHPAFTFGTDELTGIWVAKFEASGTTSAVDIKPNISSLRNINIDTMFTSCRNMEINSRYGWGTSGSGIDTHLVKNVEWGSAAYLSSSIYGKTGEITINNNSSYLTGGGAYATNVAQSTTGNIYGIYDMSGGAWEFTAAYVNNGKTNLTTYGASVVSAAAKYKDIYISSGDTETGNYEANSSKKGDAVYETSINVTGSPSWYADCARMPYSTGPFFARSGCYMSGTKAGLFAFDGNYDISGGGMSTFSSFRPCLVVNQAF